MTSAELSRIFSRSRALPTTLVMPGLFGGFGNYFVPIFQGSGEVVYPRVNNFSILILSLSYLLVILSLISEFGGGTGWTLYPPLSTSF